MTNFHPLASSMSRPILLATLLTACSAPSTPDLQPVGRVPEDARQWSIPDPRGPDLGYEHGVDLPRRPPGDGPLHFLVDLGDALELTLTPERVLLRDGPRVVATYTGLRAWDAAGDELPSRMALSCAPRCQVRLTVDDSEATYPVAVDPWYRMDVTFIAFGGELVSSVLRDDDGVAIWAGRGGTFPFVDDGSTLSPLAPMDGTERDLAVLGDYLYQSTNVGVRVYARDDQGDYTYDGTLRTDLTADLGLASDGERLFVGSSQGSVLAQLKHSVMVLADQGDGDLEEEARLEVADDGFGGQLIVADGHLIAVGEDAVYSYAIAPGYPPVSRFDAPGAGRDPAIRTRWNPERACWRSPTGSRACSSFDGTERGSSPPSHRSPVRRCPTGRSRTWCGWRQGRGWFDGATSTSMATRNCWSSARTATWAMRRGSTLPPRRWGRRCTTSAMSCCPWTAM